MSSPNAVLSGVNAEPAAITGPALRTAVVRGFLWLGTGAFLGQLVSWLSTILIIRFLSPSDYGLMATTAVFTSFIAMLGELGFGAALIQAKDLSDREIRQAFGWVIVMSALAWVVCYAFAPAIAAFYGRPELIGLVRVMSLTIPVLMLYVVPQSLNAREMNFQLKARVEFFAQIASVLVTLVLAVRGAGVWSLVAGLITLHVMKTILYNTAYRRFFVPVFTVSGSGRIFRYGMNTTGERLLSFVFTQSDTVIVGRLLGPSVLGLYSVALSLASTPMSKVMPIVTQITFTSYARIQDDPGRLQRNVLRAARVVALLGFPVFFGMAAVAPLGIPLLLGERWRAAVVPFQLLCLVLPLKALWPILSPAVAAVGRPAVNFSTMAVMAASMILAVLLGTREGLIGVCVAWLTVYPLVFVITTSRRLQAIGVNVRDYFAELGFPFVASTLMLAGIYLLGRVIQPPNPFFSLVAIVSFGVVFYGSLVLIFKRREYAELRSFLR